MIQTLDYFLEINRDQGRSYSKETKFFIEHGCNENTKPNKNTKPLGSLQKRFKAAHFTTISTALFTFHTHTQSIMTKTIKQMLIIPFTLKNAKLTLERSSGCTNEC